MKEIVIIGAGLSGTLMTIRLADRGHQVDLYEKRPDLRTTDISAGRSINLALSNRGLKALDMVGLKEKALELAIPMHGRMIHSNNDTDPKLYRYSGRENEWINSISRPGLNSLLLDKAESYSNLSIHFSHDSKGVNSIKHLISFSTPDGNKTIDVSSKIIIGADGAGSSLRREMQRRSNQLRYSFSQSFLQTGYKELNLPQDSEGNFQIFKNALHIWPRDNFMMIALPNLDASFTVTLFMPFESKTGFDSLQTPESINQLFDNNFSDVKQLFPDLLEQFESNPSSSLGTIRCFPWQINGQYLLLGDAAHAVVPFYGQGMNCSFEDCIVLDESIKKFEGDWLSIFKDYQERRKRDADAIADLAEENFYEMRDATADPVFNRKRQIELKLEHNFPEYYSKYSLVTFREDLPYHIAMARGRKQDELLMGVAKENEDIDSINLSDVMNKMKLD